MSPRNFFAELKRRYSGSIRCSIYYGTINAFRKLCEEKQP